MAHPQAPVDSSHGRVGVNADSLSALRRACAGAADGALDALVSRLVDVLRQLARTHLQQGNAAAAVALLREAGDVHPEDAGILVELGQALRHAGALDEAIDRLRRACELAPAARVVWYELGKLLKAHDDAHAARAAFERALTCDPAFIEARGALGDVLASLGDSEGAAACFRRCAGVRAHAPRAWSRIANLKTLRMSREDAAALRRLLADPSMTDNERVFAGYALSKALEDQDDYPAAFGELQKASALKRRQVTWDAGRFTAWIASIDAAFAQPAAGVGDPGFGREAIFVVGLPRSGSTLTEQILASHPQIEGASELSDLHAVLNAESQRRDREFPQWVAQATPADWRRLGEDYLQRTARWRRQRPRFTDKGLDNWPLVGAAAAMLPGARFVNCRRDPLETCLSCYRQLFHFGNAASYDLDELAANWRDYDRLARAWAARYPGQFIDAVHEDLLADPEAQVRRLLAFLGLPFDPACLQFHQSERAVNTFSAAQVRQPLRRDTARAHRYGAALDPLRAALGLGGVEWSSAE
ncbi:MAG: sulfotransferase [Proteobacteria bacterium]|nr:sulfotransferase [Pseudomonadota bacterium]